MKNRRIIDKSWFRVGGVSLVLGAVLLAMLLFNLPASAYPPEPTATPSSVVEPAHVRLDTSGIVWGSPIRTASSAPGWTDIVTEDFEGAFPDTKWTLNGDPTWGKESYRPHNGSWSGYCAGGGTHAVNPPGPYPNDMNAWMIYGPFNLSDASDAELLFYYWNKSEPDYDRLFWGASTNGSNFYGTATSGDSEGWHSVNFDLTDVYTLGDLTGQAEVWIGFAFGSDSSNTDVGAFIDDITLRAVTEAPERAKVHLPLIMKPKVVASKVIRTGEDGVVEHPSGAQIYVPRGAVPLNVAGEEGEMLFTIERWDPEDCEVPSTPPPGAEFVGDLHSMGPEGFIFERPIRVAMPFPEGFDATQGLVSMYDYDPVTEEWMNVGGRVNREGTALSADVLHLCWNWLFLTLPGDEMDGALEFDGMSGYEFDACIQDYTLKYIRPETGWEAEDQSCRIPSTGSGAPDDKTLWPLPQGSYTIQISVWRAGTPLNPPEQLGYFERVVEIDRAYNCEGYPGPCDGQIPVELQTTDLTPGRPPCMGIATPSVGVGEINVRLEWQAKADLDLWVIDPCGNKIFYDADGHECQGSWGQLDSDNRCPVELGRPENIFWDRDPPRGTYKVYVDYFADCANAGTVNYTVRRWVKGNVNTDSRTISPPASAGADGDEVLVTTFTY